MKPEKPNYGEASQYLSLLAKLGLLMVSSILISVALGVWLTNTFNWPTWAILPFILIGIAGGFKALINAIKTLK